MSFFEKCEERKGQNDEILHIQGDNIAADITTYWTYLNAYDPTRNDAIKELQQKFKKKTKHANTLVIEPCGLFFRIHDATKPQMLLQNGSQVRQIMEEVDGQKMLLTIHISPSGLVNQIKRLAKYYEIVLFTVLPR